MAKKTNAKRAPAAKKTPATKNVAVKKTPVAKKPGIAKKVAAKKAPATKKVATKKVAAKKTPATKKATAGKKPAAKRTAARQSKATQTESLLTLLAHQSRLPPETVMERALLAFAAVQGIATPEPVLPTPIEPPAAALPRVDVTEFPDDSHLPSLAPDVRLYIHPPGRPPQEMIEDAFTIGASPKCDLWLKYPTIEAQHLRIVREGARYFAEDVGTQKGSIVHGERITRYEIKHEDDIFLGGFLRVRFYLVK